MKGKKGDENAGAETSGRCAEANLKKKGQTGADDSAAIASNMTRLSCQ